MPLAIKSAVTINPLGTEVYIEFLNATGVYDVDDNPGGFGTPNPSRNTLAMVLVAQHKKVAGDVDATILAYNVTSVTSFTVLMSQDVNGVLNYVILAIPLFDDGASYDDGDIVYDNTNPSEPVIQKMVDGDWVEITADEAVSESSISKLDDYSLPIPDAIAFADNLKGQKLLALRSFIYGECPKDEEYEPTRNSFEYVDGLINNATNSFCAQAYNEAQIFIEEVFTYKTYLDDQR
ncbi:MAG: hypothetical protein QM762_12685 [Chryseolinea sp.]